MSHRTVLRTSGGGEATYSKYNERYLFEFCPPLQHLMQLLRIVRAFSSFFRWRGHEQTVSLCHTWFRQSNGPIILPTDYRNKANLRTVVAYMLKS